MNEYLFLFRGGVDPSTLTPAQVEKLTGSWFAWMGELQQQGVLRGGNPVADPGRVLSGTGPVTITPGAFGTGAEEVGGYMLVVAADLDAAARLAEGCPVLQNGGSVEVRPILDMSKAE